MSVTTLLTDWGTSNLRLWALNSVGEVLTSLTSDQGVSRLRPDQYEVVLLDLISRHRLPLAAEVDVLVCGAAGSRQGWCETDYQSLAAQSEIGYRQVATVDPRLNVKILCGLQQNDPCDVMRGEETQIAGFLDANPGFSGMLCMPGTHSKWVAVSAGRVARFQTAMTGELYALLKRDSTLAFAMQDPWQADQFDRAVRCAAEQPEGLLVALFAERAKKLTADNPCSASASVSGLLIGAEFAASQRLLEGAALHIIASNQLATLYQRAAELLGVPCVSLSGDQLALHGLKLALARIKEHGL